MMKWFGSLWSFTRSAAQRKCDQFPQLIVSKSFSEQKIFPELVFDCENLNFP